MNFTQLKVFSEVMATGSISQAALSLGRTQPAISLAIKSLEDSLGLKLFEREGRRLIPVPEAYYLKAEAEEILARLSTVSGTIQSLRTAQAGNLNIAAMPGPSAFLLPRFISRVLAGRPKTNIVLASRSSPQVRELAGTQSIDFGFADFDLPTNKNAQYSSAIIRTTSFCALHMDHPLAKRPKITASDLNGESLGTLHSAHPFQRRLTRLLEQAGAKVETRISTQFFLPLLPFIGMGQCLSIVDPLTVATELDMKTAGGRVKFIPFDESLIYEYSVLTPALRPASQLAKYVKAEWMAEIVKLMHSVGVTPQIKDAGLPLKIGPGDAQ